MNDEERWTDFRYQYIETGWFAYDRTKTIEAMRKLSERIPEDVWHNLPQLTVFAPSRALIGEVFPGSVGNSVFVYLAPRLEAKSQREVDFTVAHEFAHVALGHYKPGVDTRPADTGRHEDAPFELDADRLAESWGFKRPKNKSAMPRSK